MTQPPIRLEPLSAEERKAVLAFLKGKLIIRSVLLGVIVLSCIAALVYFNSPIGKGLFLENLETLNVVFVFLGVIVGRFLYSEYRDFSAERKSGQKKVIRTRVGKVLEGEISIGNRRFSEDDFILGSNDFHDLRPGDDVIVELSARSELLFTIRKV